MQATHVNCHMADHVGVMRQPDILVFPMDVFASGAVAIVDVVIDNEGPFHVDLDGSRGRRCAMRAAGSVAIYYCRSLMAFHVACTIRGGHRARQSEAKSE